MDISATLPRFRRFMDPYYFLFIVIRYFRRGKRQFGVKFHQNEASFTPGSYNHKRGPSRIKVRSISPVNIRRWTKDGPSPLMLKRLIAVAKNSLRIIDEGIVSSSNVDILGSVLQTSFKHYDLVLTIHPSVISRRLLIDSNEELKVFFH